MAVTVTLLEPVESGGFVYQRIAPVAPGQPARARISVAFRIDNTNLSKAVEVESISLNGEDVSEAIDVLGLDRTIPALTGTFGYQNHFGWVEDPPGTFTVYDDVVILDEPAPAEVKVSVKLVGKATPITAKGKLKAHKNDGGPLRFPGLGVSLAGNEAWHASSHHPSDHQVFALDVMLYGWKNGWTETRPGAPSTSIPREDYRIYGMPLFAMADGTVVFGLNDHEEWEKDDSTRQDANDVWLTSSPSAGTFLGAGNQLFVKSGDEIALYAHLQRGSIPAELLTHGAPVKRGQYIGKVGFSGSTSRPHFHIHVKKQGGSATPNTVNGAEAGPFRPMTFDGAWVLGTALATDLSQTGPAAWTKLANQSLPHEDALVYPAATPPAYDPKLKDAKAYIAVWHPASHIELRVAQPGFAAFVAEYTRLANDRFVLTSLATFKENGKQQFAGVFQRSTGRTGLSQFSPWSAFVADAAVKHAQGLLLVDVCTFVEGSTRWFVGVYVDGEGGQPAVRLASYEAFKTKCAALAKKGVHLIALDTYTKADGDREFVGVFQKSSAKSKLVEGAGWDAFFDAVKTASGKGVRRLVDVASIRVPKVAVPLGAPRTIYLGVLRPDEKHTGQILGGHGSYSQLGRWAEVNGAGGWRLARIHVET